MFDEEVEAYRTADFTEVNRDFALRALELAGPRGRAVDLGTGPAQIPLLLCSLAPGWRVLAVDASAEMLRAARAARAAAGLERRVELLRADATRLRKVRGGFDLVISNSLLHHLADPMPFWREVARLAGKKGAVFVQDLARPLSRSRARALVRRHAGDQTPLLRELFYRSLLAAFTPLEVRGQLRAARVRGLRVGMCSDRHLLVSGRLRLG
jgi:ubiquinone/menaquinone biosynthesis C-methylase UbiE